MLCNHMQSNQTPPSSRHPLSWQHCGGTQNLFKGMVVVCDEEGNRASLSIGETITEFTYPNLNLVLLSYFMLCNRIQSNQTPLSSRHPLSQRHCGGTRKPFAGMVVVRDQEGNRASLSIGETITEINILILI
jgi:hypothetical protein